MADARDGIVTRFDCTPPTTMSRQRFNRDPVVRSKEKTKIEKSLKRGYLRPSSEIKSLINFFSVPKGDDDVRVVYDATKSGLNKTLFAPWFSLPDIDSVCRTMDVGYWSVDNDYGEMFLNFWLHEDLRPFVGVDLTGLFPERVKARSDGGSGTFQVVSDKQVMGLSPAPYGSCQAGARARVIARGDRENTHNVFRWDKVVLNLPGSESYDPSRPWVYKARDDGTVAVDLTQFVDDLRLAAATLIEAWLGSTHLGKIASYLGYQDTPRKRRPPSQTPGDYIGCRTDSVHHDCVSKGVSPERWSKVFRHLETIESWLGTDPTRIPYKDLESIRGYLVYICVTYRAANPYLRGIHLTLDSWRPDRDEEGWRRTSVPESLLLEKGGLDFQGESDHPAFVGAVPRLADDIRALKVLFSGNTPIMAPVRPSQTSMVLYMFGDASGDGFGLSLWRHGTSHIDLEYGKWDEVEEHQSSNHREMYNFVRKLESMIENQEIPRGTELFVFTDNQVTEAAFYRGTSPSRSLFDLVLRLRKLELTGALFLRIVWVAGTRMIAQGTDGFSRGDLDNGVAQGKHMLSFVPLNVTAHQRQSTILDWLVDSLPGSQWHLLQPSEWCSLVLEQSGDFLWSPPPAAASTALEFLCDARLVWPSSAHVFICPALMTPSWRKKLGKAADVVFSITPGSPLWGKNEYEPLIVAIVAPFLRCRPWLPGRAPRFGEKFARDLSALSRTDPIQASTRLREFWSYTMERKQMPECMAL